MKYICLLLIGIIAYSINAYAEQPKFLTYKFNPSVVIIISNVPCPLEVKDKYPYAAAAMRIDGDKLAGCFTHDKDSIVIQWYKGDTTTLPANVFLTTAKPDL